MPADIRETIDKWFRDNLATGPLARQTDCYNQVHAAVNKLKDQLAPPASDAARASTHEEE